MWYALDNLIERRGWNNVKFNFALFIGRIYENEKELEMREYV